MRTKWRVVLTALAVIPFLFGGVTTANAAPPASQVAGQSTQAAPPIRPADYCPGCAANGYFAVLTAAGQTCSWQGNAPTLGACTNKNYYVSNFGYSCAGCDTIRLYWGSGYTGAYVCIPRMHYYVQGFDNLTFNRGSGGGFGQSIWNNAASAKWVGDC